MKKLFLFWPVILSLLFFSCAHSSKCCSEKCSDNKDCKEGKCPMKNKHAEDHHHHGDAEEPSSENKAEE